jgi:hypothetical protein
MPGPNSKGNVRVTYWENSDALAELKLFYPKGHTRIIRTLVHKHLEKLRKLKEETLQNVGTASAANIAFSHDRANGLVGADFDSSGGSDADADANSPG